MIYKREITILRYVSDGNINETRVIALAVVSTTTTTTGNINEINSSLYTQLGMCSNYCSIGRTDLRLSVTNR